MLDHETNPWFETFNHMFSVFHPESDSCLASASGLVADHCNKVA
jgi:hypothetical protein